MELSVQRETISKGSSSSDDSLEPAVQCCEEWWLPNWQPAASHNIRDTTQPDNPDTLRHVHSKALEDSSSNFDTTITSNSLPNCWEASPTALANVTNPHESEDFDTWLKALGASPNTEGGLMEPESSEIPLYRAGDINPTFTGDSIGGDYYYTDTVTGNSLHSLYLLANSLTDVMKVDSLSAPKLFPTAAGLNDFENSNGSETRYQLARKLVPAAEAQFMPRQERTLRNEHLLVPATEPRKRRQRSHSVERQSFKQRRGHGKYLCSRCPHGKFHARSALHS